MIQSQLPKPDIGNVAFGKGLDFLLKSFSHMPPNAQVACEVAEFCRFPNREIRLRVANIVEAVLSEVLNQNSRFGFAL